MSPRAAEGVCIAGLLSPPLATLAMPQEGRGLPVPGLRRLLEPGAGLRRALRMLAVERAPLEDALDGLGHVCQATSRFTRYGDTQIYESVLVLRCRPRPARARG